MSPGIAATACRDRGTPVPRPALGRLDNLPAMELSIREASLVLGLSPRAVRARIARGDVKARKRGATWVLRSDDLPLTEAQRAILERRAAAMHRAVDAALPARAVQGSTRGHRSVADLEPFRIGCQVLAQIPPGEPSASDPAQRARDLVLDALLDLSEAAHEFDFRARLALLRRCRTGFSRAAGWLLVAAQHLEASTALEARLLPRLGGLLRWTEHRVRRPQERAQ